MERSCDFFGSPCGDRHRSAAFLAALGGLIMCGLSIGCSTIDPRNQRVADERLADRSAGIQHAFGAIELSEAKRPPGLRYTDRVIDESIRIDARRTQRNGQVLEFLVELDRSRLEQRGPLYDTMMRNTFEGKPDQLERNAILLWY